MDGLVIQRIESSRCRRGTLLAERRSRGYTVYHVNSGTPVEWLRPAGSDERVEVLYWSLWNERWTRAGPFGPTVLSINGALRFIAAEESFLGRDLDKSPVGNAESRAKVAAIACHHNNLIHSPT